MKAPVKGAMRVHFHPMFKTRHLLFKLFIVVLLAGGLFVAWLDARVTTTFTEKMWELPAKVYARPLELYAGARLAPDDLAYELEVLGYRKVSHTRNPGPGGQES